MFRLRPLEIFLLQTLIYLILWLVNSFLAALLSLIFAGIFFLALVFSLMAELIERSKVPRAYFLIIGVSVLAPVVAAILYTIFSGEMPWEEW